MAEYAITSITVPNPLTINAPTVAAGEAIAAGQLLYIKAADDKAYLAYNTATAAEADVVGFALHAAALDQPVKYGFTQVMTINTGLAVSTYYFLASTPGAMELETDVAAGDLEYKTLVAFATSATTLVPSITASGVTKP